MTDLFVLRWIAPEDGGPAVRLLDQTELPSRSVLLDCRDVDALAEAIRSLRVRGAPALGIAGAWGVVLGAFTGMVADEAADFLAAQRPTAVNLGWACRRVAAAGPSRAALVAAARRIEDDNAAACTAMGQHGARVLLEMVGTDRPVRVLTHCNTGMLACQGDGTAFAVVRALFDQGRLERLWVDETRPLLQGARLTAYEAAVLGMPHVVVPDAAAPALLAAGDVDAVVVGADRIAANGDTANKIGTLGLAVAARHFGVPFLVVAPVSTIDLGTPDGGAIAIEQRDPDEVRTVLGQVTVVPEATPAHNLAFDVTPATLVDAIVTERDVARAPFETSLARQAAGRPRADAAAG